MTREEILEELASLEEEMDALHASYPSCQCDGKLEIRQRIFGGGEYFVWQCINCGEQRKGSIKKTEALRFLGGEVAKPFDIEIQEQWEGVCREVGEQISRLHKRKREILDHIYGPSPVLEEVKQRDGARESAIKILQISLNNVIGLVGAEQAAFLLDRELTDIKKKVVAERRSTTNRFASEDELKSWFVSCFSRDFYLRQEVKGFHIAEDVGVRIDFLLKAKDHMVNNGFDSSIFGVEVKFFPAENDFSYKTSRGIWQTISYNDCKFSTKEGYQKPKFCLIFSNLSFPDEVKMLNDTHADRDRTEWYSKLGVANHARVGTFKINGDKDRCAGWSIEFGGGIYFSCSEKDGMRKYRLGNNRLVSKLRIGNF